MQGASRPAPDHDPQGLRERHHLGAWPWAARPTPCCTCWPSPARPSVPLDAGRLRAHPRAQVPVLCDLKPAGRYVTTDLHHAGGIPPGHEGPARRRRCCTATASPSPARPWPRTWPTCPSDPRDGPGRDPAPRTSRCTRRATSSSCKGNLAPEGAVAKIAGLKTHSITGPARVFEARKPASPPSWPGRSSPATWS